MSTPFLGLRGTGDWATNEAPKNWQQYILYEFPNGSAPLYAMTSMLGQESVDSTTFNWWTKTLPTRAGTVASIYIDSALATEYVYATHQATVGIAGGVVYAKMAEAVANYFVPGALARFVDSDQVGAEVVGHVTDVVLNGASSYIAVELDEADDNHTSASSYNLATVDYVMRVGTAYPEFSDAPKPMGYKPTQYTNYCGTFRNTFAISGSASAEVLRTGDPYKEDKKDCVQDHSLDIELAGWFGEKRITTGPNGKPMYLTQGLFPFMKENNGSAIVDFQTTTDTNYSGKTWTQAGSAFLREQIRELMRYLNGGEAMVWCGDAALDGINELAEAYGQINLKVADKAYGIAVTEWHSPHGKLYFKTHPLFSRDNVLTNVMVMGLPKNAKFCPKVGNGVNRNTKFEENMQIPGQDGVLDGYITEGGWKWFFPNQWRILYGVGLDNSN